MACKEIALALPMLVFVYEWFFFQDLDRGWLKKSIAYLVTLFAGLLATAYLIYHYSPLTFLTDISQPRQFTALERFLTQGRVIFLYISLLLYPHPLRLTLDHDVSVSHSLFGPLTTLLSFLGLLTLLVVTILVAKRHRLMAFCIAWFFANLAIEALAASIGLMFEHRVYLPSMLFFLPFVLILFRCLDKPGIVVISITALIFVFSLWTHQRNTLWNDPVAFWEDAARKSPDHYRVHINLGINYLRAKSYEQARDAFEKALTLAPPYPTEIYTNIGLLYLKLGQHDVARQNLNRAVMLNPNNYVAFDLLGTLCRKLKDHAEAIKHHQMAIKINPDFAPSYHNLGILYMDIGEIDNAVNAFNKAIILRPKLSEAYSSLGLARARQGRHDLAIPTLQKAIEIDAKNEEALFNLATAYNMIGQYEMAAQTYKALLKINQKDVEAMHNLGILYLKNLGDIQQAKLYFNKALSTDPDYEQAPIVKDMLSQIVERPHVHEGSLLPDDSASRAGNRPIKP